MSFEVEQKYRVQDHELIRDRLIALRAESRGTSDHEDEYLAHPTRDFAQTNEALRIRRVGSSNAITYKGPRQPGPTKTREEIEVEFAAGPEGLAKIRRIFESLGFRPVATVLKTRTSYALTREGRHVEVVLDDAGTLGDFVEVEAIAASDADLSEAQRAVVDLAKELGLDQLEPRSYLRMTLEGRPS